MQGGGGAPACERWEGPSARGKCSILRIQSLPHLQTLAHRWDVFKGQRIGPSSLILGKGRDCGSPVHRKHSSPDHSPDNAAGVALPLGN